MTAEDFAAQLTKGEADAIRHIGSCGERGWYIHGKGANWVSVALLEKRYPRTVFVGGKADYDDRWLTLAGTDDRPTLYSPDHVQLTEFGKAVLEAIEREKII